MNTLKILAAVADALILVANAINDEIVSEAAPGKTGDKEPAKKLKPKKAPAKKDKVEEPEAEEPEAEEPEAEEPEASQFKDVAQFIKALRKLVTHGESDNAKLLALCETMGVKALKDVAPDQWDEVYRRAESGE